MLVSNPPATIERFTAGDGYAWHYRRYQPAGKQRGTLVCLHGIQSHGGWYEYSCNKLREAGYRVLYLDRRGSGLNKQARGDTPSFRRLLEDIGEFLRSPEVVGGPGATSLPVFLAAVSWGGKLAVALQRWQSELRSGGGGKQPLAGLVLLCPGLFPKIGVPPEQLLRIVGARLLAPQHKFPIPLSDPELFTASTRWRDFIKNDALALHHATARFFVESALLDRYLRKAPKHVQAPTLLMLAGCDRIIRNDKTQRFFQRFAAKDKNVITYPQAHHTLEFEPDPDRFLGELLRWLDRRCF